MRVNEASVPSQTGLALVGPTTSPLWIPACAGMTIRESARKFRMRLPWVNEAQAPVSEG